MGEGRSVICYSESVQRAVMGVVVSCDHAYRDMTTCFVRGTWGFCLNATPYPVGAMVVAKVLRRPLQCRRSLSRSDEGGICLVAVLCFVGSMVSFVDNLKDSKMPLHFHHVLRAPELDQRFGSPTVVLATAQSTCSLSEDHDHRVCEASSPFRRRTGQARARAPSK